jgi:glycosyltransferase involved in cell wall biosynthesis
MARFAMTPPLDGFPFVLDMVDVDSQKWRELSRTVRPPLAWIYRREASRLADFEGKAVMRARSTVVVNDRERAVLTALFPSAEISIIGNGVDVTRFRSPGPPSDQPRVVFCGVLNYGPNEEAVTWLIREIWPIVRQACPAARLAIVGADPTHSLRRLATEHQSIELSGGVPDVRPYLWNAAVSVAPLRVARGVQNKVLEAIASGLPVVVTRAVADGLPPAILPACFVGSAPDEIASRILDLLSRSAAERRALAHSANLEGLSWGAQLAHMVPLLERAARQDPTT